MVPVVGGTADKPAGLKQGTAMTYQELQQVEAEFQAATEVPASDAPVKRASKRRGATKAQLAHRAQLFSLCCCGRSFSAHTIDQTRDCAMARS